MEADDVSLDFGSEVKDEYTSSDSDSDGSGEEELVDDWLEDVEDAGSGGSGGSDSSSSDDDEIVGGDDALDFLDDMDLGDVEDGQGEAAAPGEDVDNSVEGMLRRVKFFAQFTKEHQVRHRAPEL